MKSRFAFYNRTFPIAWVSDSGLFHFPHTLSRIVNNRIFMLIFILSFYYCCYTGSCTARPLNLSFKLMAELKICFGKLFPADIPPFSTAVKSKATVHGFKWKIRFSLQSVTNYFGNLLCLRATLIHRKQKGSWYVIWWNFFTSCLLRLSILRN